MIALTDALKGAGDGVDAEGSHDRELQLQHVLPLLVRRPGVHDHGSGLADTSITWEIEAGQSDGVDLSGRIVTFLADFPGPTLFDGNGTARLYLDDGASDDQARELEAIFQGRKGGSFEIVGGLISNWLPSEKTAIRVSRDGDVITVNVGSAGQVSSKALRDDQGNGFTMRGGGFVGAFGMEEAVMAPSAGTRWSDPDMPREFETKSGARGAISLSGG
jgi:hypothetical protein